MLLIKIRKYDLPWQDKPKRMKQFYIKSTAVLVFLLWQSIAFSQLVTFDGTGNLPIPPGAPAQTVGITQSPCIVSGIGVIGSCVTIDNVTINLTHTFVGDIGILIVAPSGEFLDLSTGNGGAGDNYTNTVFSDNAGTFITSSAPPYTGTFKPEGRATTLNNPYSNAPPLGTHTFANTFTGINADGVWTLYVNDYVAADYGELISWSITFNLGGNPPVANAGPDVNACPGQNTTLTASGGDTYQWSNGATTPSTDVSPTSTTTYTVTVTSSGCGTDTDDVIVNVVPNPTVVLSIQNPDLCQTGCQQVTATFTGTPPFNLNYTTITSNGIQTTSSQTFGSLTATFQVCAPTGAQPGNFSVQANSITDANCTCN